MCDCYLLLYIKLLQAVVRSREFRRRTRDEAIKEYFYGRKGSKNSIFPFSFDVPFSSVTIYKIGGE